MNVSNGKRLAIFCLYAPDGIVRFRVTYILRELMTVSDEIIIVSNGDISDEGKAKLREYTNTLIIRDNIGFDGGAYADVILNHIGKENLNQYSKLILCNDTFWGPFVPFSEIFAEMEKREADWWGLNKVESKFLAHMQSYFLVFNHSVMESNTVYDFFYEMKDHLNTHVVYDIYVYFELAIYIYLHERNFKDATYSFTHNVCVYQSAAFCYLRYNLPILKYHSLKKENYHKEQLSILINTLRQRNSYPYNEIICEIRDRCGFEQDISLTMDDLPNEIFYTTVPEISAEDLIAFSQKFGSTYLYGAGLIGQRTLYSIGKKLKNVKGYLVSDSIDIKNSIIMGLPVIHYSDRDFDACIIFTLDSRNSRQVKRSRIS